MLPLAQLLAELVRRPSVNPMGRTDLPSEILYESRVGAFLEHELRNIPCEFRRQTALPGRENLIATYTPPGPAPFTLLFEAHQDTVPVDAMTVEPFGAKIDGGKMYVRGPCDVKRGIVVMLAALTRLVREKPAGSAKVIVAFTVDEENGGLGVSELMQSGVRRLRDRRRADASQHRQRPQRRRAVAWTRPGGRATVRGPMKASRGLPHGAAPARVEDYSAKLRAMPADPAGPRTISVAASRRRVAEHRAGLLPGRRDRRLRPVRPSRPRPPTWKHSCERDPASISPSHFPRVRRLRAAQPGTVGRTREAIRGGHRHGRRPARGPFRSVWHGRFADRDCRHPGDRVRPGDIAQAHTKDEWIDLRAGTGRRDYLPLRVRK